MPQAAYSIVRKGESWTIDHDGETRGEYATKEAALEAAAGAASNAIKQGHGIVITVPERELGESVLGGAVR